MPRPASSRSRRTGVAVAALTGLVLAGLAGSSASASSSPASDTEPDVAAHALSVVGTKHMTVSPASAGWGFTGTANRLLDKPVDGVGLWRDGTLSVPVEVPKRAGSEGGVLTLRAGADQCRGGAHMTVSVDGAQVLDTTVDADLARYTLGTYAVGNHSVAVTYDGDTITADCDRSLKVYTVAVRTPSQAVHPALRFGPPSLLLDSARTGYWRDLPKGGAQVELFHDGSATRAFTSAGSGAATVVVTASGDDCGGQASFDTVLDGRSLGLTTVTGQPTDYPLPAGALAAGPHTVSVTFTDDAASATCDRNLHLQRVSVIG